MLRNALTGSSRTILAPSVSLDGFILEGRFLRYTIFRDLLRPLLLVFRG